MALSYVNNTVANETGTSVVFHAPASISAGDFLVCTLSYAGASGK